MGKPSPVSGRDIAGIKDVPKDTTVITDKDFKDLAKEKGIEEKKKNNSRYKFANKVADKYGLKAEDYSGGFEMKGDNAYIRYREDEYEGFTLTLDNYKTNKKIMVDLLKATGKFTDKDIKDVIHIIEVKHCIENGCEPEFHYFAKGEKFVEVVGDIEPGYDITLSFGF